MFAHLPVGALRTFEAAARLQSFKRAAAELHVTPTAVSHQMKALEQRLGLPLFERRTRGVSLTAAGESLFRCVHGAWLDIAQPTKPRGATAFGIRLLDQLVRDHYEAR